MHRPRPRIGTWLLGPLAALTLGVVNTPVQSERTIPPSPAFDPPSHGVLFADDFSHGLGLWRADRAGTWSVVRGMLRAELPVHKKSTLNGRLMPPILTAACDARVSLG